METTDDGDGSVSAFPIFHLSMKRRKSVEK
jgi:hypothetical protein